MIVSIKRLSILILVVTIAVTSIPIFNVKVEAAKKITQADKLCFDLDPVKPVDMIFHPYYQMEFPDAYHNIQPGKTKKIPLECGADYYEDGGLAEKIKKITYSSSNSSVVSIKGYSSKKRTMPCALAIAKKKGTATLTVTHYYKNGKITQDSLNVCVMTAKEYEEYKNELVDQRCIKDYKIKEFVQQLKEDGIIWNGMTDLEEFKAVRDYIILNMIWDSYAITYPKFTNKYDDTERKNMLFFYQYNGKLYTQEMTSIMLAMTYVYRELGMEAFFDNTLTYVIIGNEKYEFHIKEMVCYGEDGKLDESTEYQCLTELQQEYEDYQIEEFLNELQNDGVIKDGMTGQERGQAVRSYFMSNIVWDPYLVIFPNFAEEHTSKEMEGMLFSYKYNNKIYACDREILRIGLMHVFDKLGVFHGDYEIEIGDLYYYDQVTKEPVRNEDVWSSEGWDDNEL